MRISDIIDALEELAPPALQESYDNAGLITGKREWDLRGALVCLDSTPEVIEEAIAKNCNLVISHHPIIFRGLKTITGSNYVERAIISAIKNDIAIYAIHTNLDNVLQPGVNGRIASLLGLVSTEPLRPLQTEATAQVAGAGVIGTLGTALPEKDFLALIKSTFGSAAIKHTPLLGKQVSRVAVCGGSGSFLLGDAIARGAQAFVTADFKYHDFFDADGRILVADVGHYESEQFTVDLLCDFLQGKFATFAPNSSETITNPVSYYI